MSDLVERLRNSCLEGGGCGECMSCLCLDRIATLEAEGARGTHCDQVGTRWKHLKTGGEYEIVGHCLIEATATSAFLYRNLKTGEVWARPKDEFMDGRFAALQETTDDR